MSRQKCPTCNSWVSPESIEIPDSLRVDKVSEIREYMGSVVVTTKDGTRHHLRHDELMIIGINKKS